MDDKSKSENSKNNVAIVILVVLASLFIINILSSSLEDDNHIANQDSEENKENEKERITIRAEKLWLEYDMNEIRADEIYNDKIIEVSGVINDIGTDILGDLYVSLRAQQYGGSVQCMFSDNKKDEIIKLDTGRHVTLRGKNPSKAIFNIILRDCKILT